MFLIFITIFPIIYGAIVAFIYGKHKIYIYDNYENFFHVIYCIVHVIIFYVFEFLYCLFCKYALNINLIEHKNCVDSSCCCEILEYLFFVFNIMVILFHIYLAIDAAVSEVELPIHHILWYILGLFVMVLILIVCFSNENMQNIENDNKNKIEERIENDVNINANVDNFRIIYTLKNIETFSLYYKGTEYVLLECVYTNLENEDVNDKILLKKEDFKIQILDNDTTNTIALEISNINDKILLEKTNKYMELSLLFNDENIVSGEKKIVLQLNEDMVKKIHY